LSGDEDLSNEAGEGAGVAEVSDRGELMRILEALIFASDEPITVDRLAKLVDEPDKKIVRDLVLALRDEYFEQGRGFNLEEIAGAYQFRTRSIYAPWIRRLRATKPSRLSPAALETLAIIAYRQPALRQEIEDIRGVDSGAVLKNLLDRRLVKIVGRKDVPGRPILYGTTREFLSIFNLKNLASLPSLRDLEELERESAEQIEMLFPERGELGEAEELDAASAGVLSPEDAAGELVPFPGGAEPASPADVADPAHAGAAAADDAEEDDPEERDDDERAEGQSPGFYYADVDAPPTREAEPPIYEALPADAPEPDTHKFDS
ncbi:MAG: SMC-Scp complex subunit ScpB, partial [Myxococcales bacterium]|nr:SMC-Scp complex subunit ScpB [Myxococcales bacterium]